VTTAFLTQNIDTNYSDLIKMFGKKNASLISQSHRYAIDHIEKIIQKQNIKCEFVRCPNYIYGVTAQSVRTLRNEEKAANSLGIPMKFRQDAHLNFKNTGYLRLDHQAKFHPLKYLSALTKYAKKNSVQFYERTEVTDINGRSPYLLT